MALRFGPPHAPTSQMIALNLLALVFLVLANGFFVGAEFALVSVRRARIETLAAAGNARARRVLKLVNNINAYISATQLGITLASLALGAISEPFVDRLLHQWLAGVPEVWRHVITFGLSIITVTFFHIVFGELVPKRLALERTEAVALATAGLLDLFYKIFSLPTRGLHWVGTRILHLMGLQGESEHGAIYTEAELRQLIEQSRKSGHLEEEEQRLINRVFDFSEAEVREAMVPRTAVIALPDTATLEETEQAFCDLGYSRLPVYHEQLDNVVGVLFMKELMPCLRPKDPRPFELREMLHPPLFVPAAARLGAVLAQMQSARQHLAFVVDEHGGVEGIVTLEDLLEEIVGEIDDEYDEEVRAQIVAEGGSYLLDGMLAVRDANRQFHLGLPEDGRYTTVAGFLLAQAGRILQPGEEVAYEGARFTVERVDRHRIRRVRYTPAPPAADKEAEAPAA
ncbi:MAG TPA: hemolysin family protein [Pyrinomonadaceae bacterium]|jgi:CBS domain containing-hemolysin-like protein